MRSFTGKRIASPAMVVILLLVLALLMYVQYQWTRQVSDATKAHVAADLRKSILAWHLDLFRTFASPPVGLRLNSEPEEYQNQKSYASRYLEWRAVAAHAGIVSNIYVWNIDGERHSHLLRLDAGTRNFEPAPWPERFESLRKRLQRKSSALSLAVAGASSPEEFFADHPQKDRPFQIGEASADALGGWVFDPEIPALFHPIAHEETGATRPKRASQLSADWIVIEYSTDYLRKEILPELAQRYFSEPQGLEYELAMVAGKDQSLLIYSSDSSSPKTGSPDATLNLFGPVWAPSLVSPISLTQNEKSDVDDDDYSASRKSYDLRGAFWFPVIHTSSSGEDWYLLVRHRHGSLSEMFTRTRRRDLAISFGILLLLVVSMGLVLLASRRAQDLAKLQVDFVAGVSHDLRTPLAIISLAADNLADGVVHGQETIVNYGVRLQAQVRQLVERVEQILLFASTDHNKARYRLRSVEVNAVIDTALRNASALLDQAGAEVDVRVGPCLPPVLTDPSALSQALQNLITNGVKYGGEDHWLGIRASVAQAGRHGTEVQLLVEDHGIGIERAELGQVFEPFYRSAVVIAKQIRGTGLGLTLAKSTVEALGGSISVSSIPGKGSTFVLHLPPAEGETPEVRAEICASS